MLFLLVTNILTEYKTVAVYPKCTKYFEQIVYTTVLYLFYINRRVVLYYIYVNCFFKIFFIIISLECIRFSFFVSFWAVNKPYGILRLFVHAACLVISHSELSLTPLYTHRHCQKGQLVNHIAYCIASNITLLSQSGGKSHKSYCKLHSEFIYLVNHLANT